MYKLGQMFEFSQNKHITHCWFYFAYTYWKLTLVHSRWLMRHLTFLLERLRLTRCVHFGEYLWRNLEVPLIPRPRWPDLFLLGEHPSSYLTVRVIVGRNSSLTARWREGFFVSWRDSCPPLTIKYISSDAGNRCDLGSSACPLLNVKKAELFFTNLSM